MNTVAEKLLEVTAGEINQKASSFSPLALAYIGDAVYEIFIRTYVMNKGNAPVNKLHKASRDLVKAESQAKMYMIIEQELTEEEKSILKRGRNAKSNSVPKNGDLGDYRHATGVEALIGYLYIQGNMDRIQELINLSLKEML